MIRVQNKIATGLDVLQFFTMRKWEFKSTKYQSIFNRLSTKDKKMYVAVDNIKIHQPDW